MKHESPIESWGFSADGKQILTQALYRLHVSGTLKRKGGNDSITLKVGSSIRNAVSGMIQNEPPGQGKSAQLWNAVKLPER